jgi:hypothetical protein
MEVRYSHTSSAWIGITNHNGHFVVVDDSYEYADCVERAIIFEGTYAACSAFADRWLNNAKVTW